MTGEVAAAAVRRHGGAAVAGVQRLSALAPAPGTWCTRSRWVAGEGGRGSIQSRRGLIESRVVPVVAGNVSITRTAKDRK